MTENPAQVSTGMEEEAEGFLVLHDPGPYPLAKNAELGIREVYLCLRFGSFYAGTVLYDRVEQTTHTVRKHGKELYLEPASWRVDRLARTLARLRFKARGLKTRASGKAEED